jgi:acetoin utilization deacetylase AcuC-like enzyme
MTTRRRTGLAWHELLMWHDTGHAAQWVSPGLTVEPDEHVESPAAKRRIRNLLDVSGVLAQLTPIEPRAATVEELERFHTPAYVARVRAASDASGGDAGESAPFGRGGFEIASLAAGACLAAVDAVVDGAVDNAYALVRPPGHHAEPDRGVGSCIFGNVALAAMHARQARGLGRVAIVDWDVHHGNGTQLAFWTDPTVLVVSVHQDSFYPPGSGHVTETGEADGAGLTVNVPLPPGSGVGAYVAAFERVVVPALRSFRPELVLVASGLDACAIDPQGRMLMHSDGYRALTRLVAAAATDLCGGRLVLCHEGGYSSAYAPYCALAIIEELSGIDSGIADPFLPVFEVMAGQVLAPHQAAAIQEAEHASVRPEGG